MRRLVRGWRHAASPRAAVGLGERLTILFCLGLVIPVIVVCAGHPVTWTHAWYGAAWATLVLALFAFGLFIDGAES